MGLKYGVNTCPKKGGCWLTNEWQPCHLTTSANQLKQHFPFGGLCLSFFKMSKCLEKMHAVSAIILAFCGRQTLLIFFSNILLKHRLLFNDIFLIYFLNSVCFTVQTINQPKPVQQAKIGDSVTIQCYFLKKRF